MEENKDIKLPERDERGRLLPGNSGNLNGRPPKDSRLKIKRVKETLEDVNLDPTAELVAMYRDPLLSRGEKFAILSLLLEWALSKPTKEIHSVNDNNNINRDVSGLTMEELVRALSILPEGKPPTIPPSAQA